MKNPIKMLIFFAIIATLFVSCDNKTTEQPEPVTSRPVAPTESNSKNNSKKGQHVPSNLVCMVNDAYMGKAQIEVPFEGKMYYGCCNMCKEKIPKDESVRYVLDPHSLKKISKADAYIVVIGDHNEVAYFENEQNFRLFLNENSL